MTQPTNHPDQSWINAAATALDHPDEATVYDNLQPRLRASVRRGVPITTGLPDIEINTRALRLVLAQTIWQSCAREIAALEFDTERKVLTGVRIELIGRYDDRLRVLGDRVREAIQEKLRDLVGSRPGDPIAVDLRWTDLEPGARDR
jgi:hypothetical protein